MQPRGIEWPSLPTTGSELILEEISSALFAVKS
jgi:hypothetical protein